MVDGPVQASHTVLSSRKLGDILLYIFYSNLCLQLLRLAALPLGASLVSSTCAYLGMKAHFGDGETFITVS